MMKMMSYRQESSNILTESELDQKISFALKLDAFIWQENTAFALALLSRHKKEDMCDKSTYWPKMCVQVPVSSLELDLLCKQSSNPTKQHFSILMITKDDSLQAV